MSRCFPYPPSGYVKNGARSEALIESIKLQREREKTKTERRKEKSSEKKQRRKEKKLNDIDDRRVKKLYDEKFSQEEKYRADPIKAYLQKGRDSENEAEQLERSDLSEEHEQPINCGNLCYVSDSTQSSNKRKRDEPPYNGSQNHGNIVRIRLPLKKHSEPDASSLNRKQLGSTSRKVDSLAHQKIEIDYVPGKEQCCSVNASTNIVAKELSLRRDKDLPNSAPGKEIFDRDCAETAIGTNFYKGEQQWPESLYTILDWFPPLELEKNDLHDEEWLFGTKQQDRHGHKRFKAGNDVSPCGNPTLWQHAQFLPHADIYALPYTVPF